MKKHALSTAVVGALLAPAGASAAVVIEDLLEVYGKVHVSADYHQTDLEDADGLSFSSNSSRIGFKGAYPLTPALSVLYQIEQEVAVDDPDGNGFATRNSFLGASGAFGTLAFGRIDTPFKSLGGDYTLFSDTVADQRAILGAGATAGNQVNIRADNALRYTNSFNETVNVSALYSTDWAGSPGESDAAADDRELYSIGAEMVFGGFSLAAAYENIATFDEGTLGAGELDGFRVGGAYETGPVRVGLIYESLNHDLDAGGSGEFDRDAWGVNVAYALNATTKLMGQVMQADDYADTTETGGTQYALGMTHLLAKPLEVYAIYTTTRNDDGASFQGIDGGHGDELDTIPGGDASAFSVGAILSF